MIHVCFGLHDGDGRYSKFVGTTMASIFANTSLPVTIHILHDATLTDDNREKFSYLAGRYAQAVKFHNVDALCPDEINFLREKLAAQINSRFSIGAFYRLLIKKILGGGKAIYLDADIIVNLDIAELWRHDLNNFPVAAVPEVAATLDNMISEKFLINSGRVKAEDYFCSGVMIFNLDALNENFFRDGVQFLADNPACESVDQDILNAFFAANYLKLDQKFDSFVLAEQRRNISTVTKKIYHYAGNGIELKLDNAFNRLWLENFSCTPWFDIDTLGKLGDAFRNKIDNCIMTAQQMMKLSIEHRRAFFVEPNNIQVIKELFHVQDDELIIEARDTASIEELAAKMTELRGQRIFFIFLQRYEVVCVELLRRGFKELADFVNGLMFMTRSQSQQPYPMNEYSLVRAL